MIEPNLNQRSKTLDALLFGLLLTLPLVSNAQPSRPTSFEQFQRSGYTSQTYNNNNNQNSDKLITLDVFLANNNITYQERNIYENNSSYVSINFSYGKQNNTLNLPHGVNPRDIIVLPRGNSYHMLIPGNHFSFNNQIYSLPKNSKSTGFNFEFALTNKGLGFLGINYYYKNKNSFFSVGAAYSNSNKTRSNSNSSRSSGGASHCSGLRNRR